MYLKNCVTIKKKKCFPFIENEESNFMKPKLYRWVAFLENNITVATRRSNRK